MRHLKPDVQLLAMEHAACLHPALVVFPPPCVRTPVIHVEEVRLPDSLGCQHLKVEVRVSDADRHLAPLAVEALHHMRWDIDRRALFVRDPHDEDRWEPFAVGKLSLIVAALVDAARAGDSGVRAAVTGMVF